MAAQITPAPDLARRQTDAAQTCGYISGQLNSPLTCGGSYSCSINGDAANFFGCCDSFGSCTSDWHTCANWGEPTLGQICSEIYTQCLNCGADAPFCATYQRYFSTGAASPLTSLFCAPESTVVTALLHANPAVETSATSSPAASTPVSSSEANSAVQPSSVTLPPSSTSANSPASSSTSSLSPSASSTLSSSTPLTSSSIPSTSSSTSNTSSAAVLKSSSTATSNPSQVLQTSTSASSPTASLGPSHKKLSKGDIAGIVVGSIIGTIILGFIIYCLVPFCRKIRNRCRRRVTSNPGPQYEMDQIPAPQSSGAGPQYSQSANSAVNNSYPPTYSEAESALPSLSDSFQPGRV